MRWGRSGVLHPKLATKRNLASWDRGPAVRPRPPGSWAAWTEPTTNLIPRWAAAGRRTQPGIGAASSSRIGNRGEETSRVNQRRFLSLLFPMERPAPNLGVAMLQPHLAIR